MHHPLELAYAKEEYSHGLLPGREVIIIVVFPIGFSYSIFSYEKNRKKLGVSNS